MAAYHAARGKTLYDAMEALYAEHGRYGEETVNIFMHGIDGIDRMKSLMKRLREEPLPHIAGVKSVALRDYLSGKRRLLAAGEAEPMELSGSDVLCYELEDGTIVLIRPSGTEPKMKVYIMAKAGSVEECRKKLEGCKAFMKETIV
jgi:phosphoglucomutase